MKELIYKGSVKNIYRVNSPNAKLLHFDFTDQYSVFDWGEMPDHIPEKGKALTAFANGLFSAVSNPETWQFLEGSTEFKGKYDRMLIDEVLKKAIPTHRFEGKDAGPLSEFIVTELEIIHPKRVKTPHGMIWDYRRHIEVQNNKVVPLEVVFRFGAPEGSSILRRLDRDSALVRKLGIEGSVNPGVDFPNPLIEFTTKYETTDRLLTDQEAFVISGVSEEIFNKIIFYTDVISTYMKKVFSDKGLKLWDGKFEFGLNDQGQLILCDSIGPDEIRLTSDGIHLSKEVLRQAYKGSDWANTVTEAKRLANERGELDWKNIVTDELKKFPEKLPAEMISTATEMYQALANTLCGSKVFPSAPQIEEVISKLKGGVS